MFSLGYNARASAASGQVQVSLGYACQNAYGNYSVTIGSGTEVIEFITDLIQMLLGQEFPDKRYKEEIKDNTDCGLDFINDLRPVTFKWKPKSRN